MKRFPIAVKSLILLMVFSLLPVYMATATTSNISNEGRVDLIQNESDSINPNSVPTGYMTARAYDMTHKMMEVQWTIGVISPIYQVDVVTTFGDGIPVTQAYHVNPATTICRDAAQHTFATAGYHTASVSGYAYTFDGTFHSVNPIAVSCNLTD